MKSVSLLTVAALVAGVVSFGINTPSDVSECVPTQFTWSAGSPPYYLSIQPGNDPSGAPLQQYGPLTGTSMTWPTNITSGQSVSLTLKDSTGASVQSAPFPIEAGSTSCLSASGSSSAASGSSSSAAAGSSSAAGSTSAGASTSGSSTPAPSSTAPSGTSSGASSSTTSASGASSGALSNAVNVVFAGAVGAAAFAFLA